MFKRLLTIVFSTFIIFSCSKQDQEKNFFPGNQHYDIKTIKTNLLEWVKGKNSFDSSNVMHELIREASWDNINISKINQCEYLAYVPVNFNNRETGFIFILNSRNNIVEEGYFSEIIYKKLGVTGSDNNVQLSPSKIISNFYKYRKSSFTGSLSVFSINNKFLWEMGFENGEEVYKKKIENLPAQPMSRTSAVDKTSSLSSTNQCTLYYMVTYWSDGSVDREYIGGSCHGCEQTKIFRKSSENSIRTVCDPSGGTGGGSSSAPTSVTDIINNITDPCIKSTVQQMINSTLKNTITDILNLTFQVSNKVNLTFSPKRRLYYCRV